MYVSGISSNTIYNDKSDWLVYGLYYAIYYVVNGLTNTKALLTGYSEQNTVRLLLALNHEDLILKYSIDGL